MTVDELQDLTAIEVHGMTYTRACAKRVAEFAAAAVQERQRITGLVGGGGGDEWRPGDLEALEDLIAWSEGIEEDLKDPEFAVGAPMEAWIKLAKARDLFNTILEVGAGVTHEGEAAALVAEDKLLGTTKSLPWL